MLIFLAGARSAALGCGLGPLLDLCWRSWAAPRTYVAGLGALLGLRCRSWAAFAPYVGGLGPLFGLMWPGLAALGASVAGLRLSWGMCGSEITTVVLQCLGASAGQLRKA